MNREINFRAWNKTTKEYNRYVEIYCYIDGSTGCSAGRNNNMPIGNSENFILEQYTGLKDINGVEIYEGDIIKIPDDYDTYGFYAGEIYEIFFNAGGFRCKPKFNPKAKGIWLEHNGEFQILGNIYENPELC